MKRPRLSLGLGWAATLVAAISLTGLAASPLQTPDGAGRFTGPDGEAFALDTADEVLEFLRTARVAETSQIGGGTNRPLRVALEKDGVRVNAIFRTVDKRRDRVRLDNKVYRGFHDSYIYECAAYNLSRLLGIDNVPPCTRRSLAGTDGTIQLWIENAMTEKDRRQAGKEPPEPLAWARQRQTMHLFDALIYNFDRNQGNMLITPDWKLWFIDHTRSFRPDPEVEAMARLVWCERGLWEKLRTLDAQLLRSHLKPLLDKFQIKGLLRRRDRIVAHLTDRIEALGEDRVLYDLDDEGDGLDPADLSTDGPDDDLPEGPSVVEEIRNPG